MMRRCFIFILICASCADALTLGEIESQVRRYLVDTSTIQTRQRWSSAEIIHLANQAQREICDTVWCITRSTDIPLVSGTTFYAVPMDFYVQKRVVYNDRDVLPETTIENLDRDDSSWVTAATGTPTSYYMSSDRERIGLYPAPGPGVRIRLDYIARPRDMSETTDVPFNNLVKLYPYHDLIVHRVVGLCLLADNQIAKAQYFLVMYTSGLQSMAGAVGVSPNHVPNFIWRRE